MTAGEEDFDLSLVRVLRVGTADKPLYEPAKQLRVETLLRPVGVEEWFHLDDASDHFVAVGYGKVLGVVLFHEGEHRLHQMAVDARFQRRGIGALLVAALEAFARRRGVPEITVHARDYAVRFYERHGYRKEGPPFQEVGMDHFMMRKQMDPATPTPTPTPTPTATSGELEFRRATEADVEQLLALINAAYGVERWFKDPTVCDGERTHAEEVRARVRGEGEEGEAGMECAVDPAEPERVVGCFEFKAPPGADAYIGMLSVHPRQQGQRLGARMLARAQEKARAAGCPGLSLVVVDCRPELVTYYARHGFTLAGSFPWPEGGKHVLRPGCEVGFIRMRKPLGPEREAQRV